MDDDGEFKPVNNDVPYGIELDSFNRIAFEPVNTSAIKLEIVLQDDWSAGIQEIVIE